MMLGIPKSILSGRRTFSKSASAQTTRKERLLERDIREAYEAEGIEGVKRVMGTGKTQAYEAVAKFGLLKSRLAKEDREAVESHVSLRFDYLKRKWGWEPGQERIVVRKSKTYLAKKGFKMGKVVVDSGTWIVQYTIPSARILRYMEAYGLRVISAGNREVLVGGLAGFHLTYVAAAA